MDAVINGLTPGQRFWRMLKPDAQEIRNVYIYSFFTVLVNLSLPLGFQAIINLIQGGQMSTSWVVLVSFVVLGVFITGVLQIFQQRITEDLQQKIFTRAAFEFAYRIPKIRMEALYKYYAPELMNRFFDVVSIQKGLAKMLIDFSSATLYVFFGVILLSLYHSFFILFSVILVLLILALFRFTVKRGLETSLRESKHKYQLVHWLEELARTNSTFKLAGESSLPLQRTDRHVGDYLKARESHFGVLVEQYWLMVIFKVLVTSGLLAIGGILVMEQQMNIGQFVAAEIIIIMVVGAVEKFVISMETVYDVLTSLEKIGQVTDLELESAHGIDIRENCGEEGIELILDHVSFGYPDSKRDTLNGLTLSVSSNERIVVAGPNGSGKSTLLQIMAGLYDVREGSIAYNGLPKGNLDLNSLHLVIGDYLTQELMFQGTVMENIAMGREEATFDNVKWAVENLNLWEFIRSLPNGFDTVLDPQGRKLPGSIVQKLLLARSIVDKPKLLLLEDPFVSIDIHERKSIIEFITSKVNKWTLVAVSSDPYLIQCSDRVVVLQQGKVVSSSSGGQGSHRQTGD